MPTPKIAQREPYAVDVAAGRTYFWCTCGHSAKQPFCDGSHDPHGMQPMRFVAEKNDTVFLCGCKHTKTQPFCDGSHKHA